MGHSDVSVRTEGHPADSRPATEGTQEVKPKRRKRRRRKTLSLCCGALSLKPLLETGVHVPTQKLKNRDDSNSDRKSYVASRDLSTDVLIMDSYGFSVQSNVFTCLVLSVQKQTGDIMFQSLSSGEIQE